MAAPQSPRAPVHVFFDLDGTLIDSTAGLRSCFHHALGTLGYPPPLDDRLRRCFGPPLASAFRLLLDSDDDALVEAAIAAYRARYAAAGVLEFTPYAGVLAGVRAIHGAGHRLRLVTVKSEPYARQIVGQMGIAELFDGLHAPSLADRTRTKLDVLRAAVDAVGGAPDGIVMIGDRADDIGAAKACGVRSIGAAWGFAPEGELHAARPDVIAHSMADVIEWICAR